MFEGTIIENIIYTGLWILTAVAVGGIYTFVHHRDRQEDAKIRHNETHDAERNALKLIMRDRLSDLAHKYREQGFVTETQFTDATEHFDTYKSLYGNSFGDSIYKEICELHRRSKNAKSN